MLKQFQELLRNVGALGVGFKLALIVSSYIGAGSFAKWVISVWYPATRRFWAIAAENLSFPVLTDSEKDALTALCFFIPFGISALITAIKGREIEADYAIEIERLSATILGGAFFYLICRSIIQSLIGGA